MGNPAARARVASIAAKEHDAGTQRVTLSAIEPDGRLKVETADGRILSCEWLQTSAETDLALEPGDSLLLLLLQPGIPVVIGRIGRYRYPVPKSDVRIEAADSLSLRCGGSSIELRADGKLMVKGEDVLVKARGTQRIKAGTVNIN